MAPDTMQILKDALELPLQERAALIDKLLGSLDQPDKEIDNLWRKEIDDRIAAYQRGEIKAVPIEDVLAKYRK